MEDETTMMEMNLRNENGMKRIMIMDGLLGKWIVRLGRYDFLIAFVFDRRVRVGCHFLVRFFRIRSEMFSPKTKSRKGVIEWGLPQNNQPNKIL